MKNLWTLYFIKPREISLDFYHWNRIWLKKNSHPDDDGEEEEGDSGRCEKRGQADVDGVDADTRDAVWVWINQMNQTIVT